MDWAALGAFLSGASAVLSAIIALRLTRKHAEEECERRMKAFRNGLREGRK